MPILSSTCEDLKTTCRDDRIYVPGSKIHVRRQRNRYSALGEVLAAHERSAVLLRAFSSAPLEYYLVSLLGRGLYGSLVAPLREGGLSSWSEGPVA